MQEDKKMTVEKFLSLHKLGPEYIDVDSVLSFFMSEMKKGLNGEKSSLQMIPTYQSVSHLGVPRNEKVIVMDAGGTNFRTSLVSFNDKGESIVEDFAVTEMPGRDREVSAKEFYTILADNVERFMGKSNRIGFCFSYPALVTEDHDGIPVMFSKEIKAPEVIGKPLGKNLLLNLKERGYDVSKMKISIVNDTVATLLASTKIPGSPEDYIGFILGTGTNTAYVEKNSNIGKIKSNEGSQIINVESGCLDLVIEGLDEEFMKTTKDPERYRFEKKISGAYLGQFAYLVLHEAAKEGVFSSYFASKVETLKTIETFHLSLYLEGKDNPISEIARDEDKEDILRIIRAIVDRAALLSAINLISVAISSGSKNVIINADGSTFYKLDGLEKSVKKYLDKYLTEKYGIKYSIVSVSSSPSIGAAIAGLTV